MYQVGIYYVLPLQASNDVRTNPVSQILRFISIIQYRAQFINVQNWKFRILLSWTETSIFNRIIVNKNEQWYINPSRYTVWVVRFYSVCVYSCSARWASVVCRDVAVRVCCKNNKRCRNEYYRPMNIILLLLLLLSLQLNYRCLLGPLKIRKYHCILKQLYGTTVRGYGRAAGSTKPPK